MNFLRILSLHWSARTSRRAFLIVLLAAAVSLPAFAASAGPAILVFGDSVSAGYGLPQGSGWVNLLERKLTADGYPFRVVNASISGDTTAGGRSRLPAALAQHKPRLVILELGANDGLRGTRLDAMRENLVAMIRQCRSAGAQVLLVGMRLPPNYGPAYVDAFHNSFRQVADAERTPLVPFFFEGFAERAERFQADRIHPNESAQALLLANVWPALTPLLRAGK